MAGAVSFTRIVTRPEPVTDAALRKVREDIADAFGSIAVKQIQGTIWAMSRFKKTTGKSTRAWVYKVEPGAKALIIYNLAVNRYGTNYPKFVHLAGKPKTDRLMLEVERYAQEDLAKRMGRALAYAGIKARKEGRLVSKTEVLSG